jgi:hypothetical protein
MRWNSHWRTFKAILHMNIRCLNTYIAKLMLVGGLIYLLEQIGTHVINLFICLGLTAKK